LPVTWEAGISLIAPRGREARLVAAALDLQHGALPAPRWVPDAAHSTGASPVTAAAGDTVRG
jgi:hypothetical protein